MPIDFDKTVNASVAKVFGVAATGGGKATYAPQSGPSFQIDGVFDEAWQTVELSKGRGPSIPISTTKPRFGVRASEFPEGVTPKQDDGLTLAGGRAFTVADVQPDGFKYFYLVLTEA